LLHGRTNPALGAQASTYSIGIHEDTFSVTFYEMKVDAITAAAGYSD
jgi:hypothetical protein